LPPVTLLERHVIRGTSTRRATVNWKRIVAWSLVILAGTYAVAIVSALTMGSWQIYGETLEQAVVNSGFVRRSGYVVVGAVLFWRFAAPIRSNRLLHVVVAYLIVQVLDMGTSLLLGEAIEDLLDPWAIGRVLLAAILGFALASWSSRASGQRLTSRIDS
jgi:hypothetical protein